MKKTVMIMMTAVCKKKAVESCLRPMARAIGYRTRADIPPIQDGYLLKRYSKIRTNPNIIKKPLVSSPPRVVRAASIAVRKIIITCTHLEITEFQKMVTIAIMPKREIETKYQTVFSRTVFLPGEPITTNIFEMSAMIAAAPMQIPTIFCKLPEAATNRFMDFRTDTAR
jgi:hypothetical protein